MISLNVVATLNGSLKLPPSGRWWARLQLAQGVEVSGQGILQLPEGLTLKGTIKRAGPGPFGRTSVLLVGGGDALAEAVEPAQFLKAPARLIFRHILGGGELLNSDSEELDTELPSWTISKGPRVEALGQLCRNLGTTWRIALDGSVVIGAPTPTTPDVEFVRLREDRSTHTIRFQVTPPIIEPGYILAGFEVDTVVYHWTAETIVAEVRHV